MKYINLIHLTDCSKHYAQLQHGTIDYLTSVCRMEKNGVHLIDCMESYLFKYGESIWTVATIGDRSFPSESNRRYWAAEREVTEKATKSMPENNFYSVFFYTGAVLWNGTVFRLGYDKQITWQVSERAVPNYFNLFVCIIRVLKYTALMKNRYYICYFS